jgi:hypothetical protein
VAAIEAGGTARLNLKHPELSLISLSHAKGAVHKCTVTAIRNSRNW